MLEWIADELSSLKAHLEDEGIFEMIQEQISLDVEESGKAFIAALEAWHADTFVTYDEHGMIDMVYPCHGCSICKAIHATKNAVNDIHLTQGSEPPYSQESEQ